jgi:DNA ligase-1
MPTEFQVLVNLCEKLEATKKRLQMTELVADFLKRLSDDEVEPATSMILGRSFPKWDQRVLEVSWATLSDIIKRLTNINWKDFKDAFNQTGDIGGATRIVFENAGRLQKQATLFEKPLTILEVRHSLETIAEITGFGSREKKERILEALLSAANPLEAKYIVKILIGEMRTGFYEGMMEQSVAKAFNIPIDLVQRASMLTGDIAEVAALAKTEGKDGILNLQFQVFRPIKPMMAQMAEDVNEILKEHGKETALEYKLDGARIQIHKSGNNAKIYSRRLTDVTSSLPEVVQSVREHVKAREAILEGEVIAVGEDGAPMLFQHLMRRFRRVHYIEEMTKQIPVKLYLFDLLYFDGKSLIDEPYVKRRRKLKEIAGNIQLTKQIVTNDLQEAENFFQEAIKEGHEGLMAKKLDSHYTPGVRGKRWFKVKKILEPLDLVIVTAEYGYGRRRGWLSDYYLAARDAETGELLKVGKTFKGLTDKEIIDMTERLKELAVKEEHGRITVIPKIVVEVAYNEIQKSPTYKCGMALRFARITRIRNDKNPEEIDTIQRVREIYERQYEKKARTPNL